MSKTLLSLDDGIEYLSSFLNKSKDQIIKEVQHTVISHEKRKRIIRETKINDLSKVTIHELNNIIKCENELDSLEILLDSSRKFVKNFNDLFLNSYLSELFVPEETNENHNVD